MLEIQERFDTAGYEHIIAAAGINNVHITEALDGSTAIGFIAYAYEAERTVVYDFDDDGDLMLCDGLVRSVMLKSAMKGIETMTFELPDTGKLASLVKLHFLAEGSNVCKNIDGFLNACEHCKK
jgi:hypothetical protein